MNTLVISSDEDDDTSKTKKDAKFVNKSPRKRLKTPRTSNPKQYSAKKILPEVVTSIELNDNGDDEEYQLDLHTKSKKELEVQKSFLPKPKPTDPPSPQNNLKKNVMTLFPSLKSLKESPRKVVNSPTNVSTSDINFPKPISNSITITPVRLKPESISTPEQPKNTSTFSNNESEQSVTMFPYLKVKNIDTMKDQGPGKSTLEINQSTNLFILDSKQSKNVLNNMKYGLPTTNLSVIRTDEDGSPFQISDVQSLASGKGVTLTPIKPQKLPITSKRKRASNIPIQSEIICLDDDEVQPNKISKPEMEVTVADLDSDTEKEVTQKSPEVVCIELDEVEEQVYTEDNLENEIDDIVCIETNIDKIDLSSSDSEDENTKSNKSKNTLESRHNKPISNKSEETSESTHGNCEDVDKVKNIGAVDQSEERTHSNANTTEKESKEELMQSNGADNQLFQQLQQLCTSIIVKEFVNDNKINKALASENIALVDTTGGITQKIKTPNIVVHKGDTNSSPNKISPPFLTESTITSKIVNQNTDKIRPDKIALNSQENIVENLSNQLAESNELQRDDEREVDTPEIEISGGVINLDSDDSNSHEITNPIKKQSATTLYEKINTSCVVLLNKNEKLEDIIKKANPATPERTSPVSERPDSPEEFVNISIDELFDAFLEKCQSDAVPLDSRDVITTKISSLRRRYDKLDEEYRESDIFAKFLKLKIAEIETKPKLAIVAFDSVLTELRNNKTLAEPEAIEGLDKEKAAKVKKLETLLKLLKRKIEELETTEMGVDEEWDENTVFMQMDRYYKKSATVYAKLCQLCDEDPRDGRPSFTKIHFQGSQHPEINSAITKLYNKNREFPDFRTIDKCVRKCVKKHKLHFTNSQLENEVRSLFKSLGRLLQKRRLKDFKESLTCYPRKGDQYDFIDPANQDPELDSILKDSLKHGQKKMTEVMDSFTRKQNEGEDNVVSDCSVNSCASSSENEDDG